MMSRAESATAVSSVCWAKNTSAVSMMANIMAMKGSRISPNSTAEEPSSRRNETPDRDQRGDSLHLDGELVPRDLEHGKTPRFRNDGRADTSCFTENLLSNCFARRPRGAPGVENLLTKTMARIQGLAAGDAPVGSARRLRLGLRRTGGGLPDGLGEILRGIAKRDAALAIRCAAIGLAVDAPVDDHHRILRTNHFDAAFRQYGAGAIERDQVGGSITFGRSRPEGRPAAP